MRKDIGKRTNSVNIFNEIAEILIKDKRFVKDDNTIDKIGFRNAINSLDEIILKKLYTNKIIKSRYFKEVGNLTVFDKTEFMYLFENVKFLGDSYTRFKDDIGLIDKNEKFIIDNDDVVLSFPFKDCILEFDSTDVNDKRDEYFINERIKKEKIDVMFENKVFVNCKKIDKDGEKSIDRFNVNDNLLIKGNNLLALHTLLPVYKESIKLMYWDILYNTGGKDGDKVPYNDSFKHSSWLTMMKNRLDIAKKLLKDDGVICLQCDDNEMAYLKVLMDEILGRENFINNISVNMSNMSGQKINNAINGKKFPKLKETILIYANNKEKVKLSIPKINKEEWDNEYNKIIPEWKESDYGLFEIEDIECGNKAIANYHIYSLIDYAKMENIIIDDEWKFNNSYRIFATKPNSALLKKVKQIKFDTPISFVNNASGDNKLIITDFNRATTTARLELVSALTNNSVYFGDNWTDIVTTGGTAQEGGVVLKGGKKPEKLLKRIIEMGSEKGDIVLDAYFGTGTTGAVAMKMNRRFIGIEQLDKHVSELAVPRLKNVIKGDETGISKLPDVNWQGGGSFVYVELAKLNQNYIDKINVIKKSEENKLLSIYNDIKNNAYLNCYINTNRIDSQTEKFNSLNFSDKKKFLIELLDKNQLYVNFMDIDDKEFNISDNDKKFTKSFYKKGN